MQLNQSAVQIRPRSTWEAIDLGFAMVRVWWLPLCGFWLLPLLLLSLLCYSLSVINLWLAASLFWILKPLLDSLLLYFFSQRLFNQQPNLKSSVQKLARHVFKHSLRQGDLMMRFSLGRSYEQPVWLLESQSTLKARRQRLKLLGQKMQHAAIWLTLLCWAGEWLLYLTLCVLLTMLLPSTEDGIWLAVIHDSGASIGLLMLAAVFHVVAIACIEPFFVAAGFALYLNRRTQLEAWDIELLFRRMGHRLQVQNQAG